MTDPSCRRLAGGLRFAHAGSVVPDRSRDGHHRRGVPRGRIVRAGRRKRAPRARQRGAVGAILLCASVDQPLLDFGLPANFIGEIEPHLSVGNGREQLYFNVLRRGTRFELQLKGGRSVDITRRLGDVSWLREARAAASGQEASVASAPRGAVAEARLDCGRGGGVRSGDDHRFFARYVDEGLRPLDPIDLRNEAVYLVEARLMNAAPRSRALRRIVARGGPSGLPRDLAEQHDYYAHGSRRR